MRGITWWYLLPFLAGISYAVPLIAAIRAPVRLLPIPLQVVAVYCAIALFEGCVMILLSLQSRESLWLIHLFTPVEVFLILLAYSGWQLRESARTMLVSMIPLFIAVWAFLLTTSDSLRDFPVYGRTVSALLIIAVAAYTLVVRTQHASTMVTSHAWFWMSVALLVYFPYLVLLNPLSSALQGSGDLLIRALYQVNGVLMIVSNLFVTRAILCQIRHSSGGSSSPRLSPA